MAGRLISGLVFFKIWRRVPTRLQVITFSQVKRTLSALYEGTDCWKILGGVSDDHLNNVANWAMSVMCRLREGDLKECKLHRRTRTGEIRKDAEAMQSLGDEFIANILKVHVGGWHWCWICG